MSLLGIGVPALRSDEAIRPKRSAVVRVTGSRVTRSSAKNSSSSFAFRSNRVPLRKPKQQLADDDD